MHDYATGADWEWQGDRWFHAASTFKVAILLALLKRLEGGELRLRDHLQVRNRFLSLTSALPFRVARERDGDGTVHARVGQSLPLDQLARVMITRSSNLATNLLLEFLTVEAVQAYLSGAGVEGVAVRRGVEDLAAHEAGINNETTPEGLRALFRCFAEERFLSEESRQVGVEILAAQEFNRMIPARLPKGVRVAHKTGEISTHCHDAGLVFPPDRPPYVVAILTETNGSSEGRQRAVAEISAAIYEAIVGGSE